MTDEMLNNTVEWSEGTDESVWMFDTDKSLWVNTRSSVFPCLCVGAWTCWVQLKQSVCVRSFVAVLSALSFTWVLKSPTRRCIPCNDCRWSSNSQNSDWITDWYPWGKYTHVVISVSQLSLKDVIWCSNDVKGFKYSIRNWNKLVYLYFGVERHNRNTPIFYSPL